MFLEPLFPNSHKSPLPKGCRPIQDRDTWDHWQHASVHLLSVLLFLLSDMLPEEWQG